MAGRDSLPHFPAPGKGQPRPPPPTQSQGNNMAYQQQPPYQQQQYQQPAAVPAAYPSPGSPVGGYQVGPPASGYGAPQQGYQQGYGQPGYNPGRPVSAAPPVGVDPQLYNLFRAADTNGSGQLSERELSRALVNGDWTPFDPKTIKLMVKMFDVDRYGSVYLPL
jgi:peflin